MSTPPSPPAPTPTGGEAAPAAAPAQMLPTPVILGATLRSAKNVSNLILSPGRFPQVEQNGQLVPTKIAGLPNGFPTQGKNGRAGVKQHSAGSRGFAALSEAAARWLNLVPRDIASRRGDLFLHARRLGRGSSLLRGGRCGNGRRSRGRHLGQHLIEQRGTRTGFLLSPLPVLVGMLGIAGLANHLRYLPFDHARNGMVQQEPATRTIIVNQVAETQRGLSHGITSEEILTRAYSVSQRIIALPPQKSTGRTSAAARVDRPGAHHAKA